MLDLDGGYQEVSSPCRNLDSDSPTAGSIFFGSSLTLYQDPAFAEPQIDQLVDGFEGWFDSVDGIAGLQSFTIIDQQAFTDPLVLQEPISDYCGGDGVTSIVPDVIGGIDISDACRVHDFNYSSRSTMSRLDADVQFLRDLQRELTEGGMSDAAAAAISAFYYAAVREWGCYFYEGPGSRL